MLSTKVNESNILPPPILLKIWRLIKHRRNSIFRYDWEKVFFFYFDFFFFLQAFSLYEHKQK